MSTALTNGQNFSAEQKEYLTGLFAGIAAATRKKNRLLQGWS